MTSVKAFAVLALCFAVIAFAHHSEARAAADRTSTPDSDAHVEADIIVGHIEEMQEQARRGLALLANGKIEQEVAAETEHDTYRRLYNAVERYNALRKTACAGKIAAGNLCGDTPYLPLWYAGRARPDTSGGGLKVMAEDMQNTMTPLWDAVCAKAKAKSGDAHFCAIE